MSLSPGKVLIAAIEFWDAPCQVGSHQIAREFLRAGWEVAFISAPLTPFHLLKIKDPVTLQRFSSYRSGGKTEYEGKLWCYTPFSLIAPDLRPIFNSKTFAENWHNLSYPNLPEMVKKAGFGDVDLLYFDSIYQPFWLDNISYKKSLLRIHDATSAFSGFSKGLKQVEGKIAQSVDSVVYSAKTLEKYVKDLSPNNIFYMPNGVNCEFFTNGSHNIPQEYKEITSPIAVYVGTLGEWFDFELFNSVAQSLPDVAFVLIGPDTLAREKVRPLSNVHIIGSKKHQELPQYLHNANVGIIPFDVLNHAELIGSVNPLKLYEYMACGLPVVSMNWEELRLINSPAILCNTTSEFSSAVKKSIEEETDKSLYIEYAKKHDWEKSFNNLLKFIGES